MEERRNEFGEIVVTVENQDEFLAAIDHRPGEELLIEAPPGVGESLGFDDPEPRNV